MGHEFDDFADVEWAEGDGDSVDDADEYDEDDDSGDSDDDDQLHQARHVPDHLPLQHLKHHHVDDGARGDSLQRQTTYNFLSLEDFFGTWNMETIIWESELDSSEIAIPIPMPIGLSGIRIRSPLVIHSRIQCWMVQKKRRKTLGSCK